MVRGKKGQHNSIPIIGGRGGGSKGGKRREDSGGIVMKKGLGEGVVGLPLFIEREPRLLVLTPPCFWRLGGKNVGGPEKRGGIIGQRT